MKITDLKHQLINGIKQSQNDLLLEEMFRVLTNGEADTDLLKLSHDQQQAVEEAREEYRQGKYLSEEQADKDIDEWLDD